MKIIVGSNIIEVTKEEIKTLLGKPVSCNGKVIGRIIEVDFTEYGDTLLE